MAIRPRVKPSASALAPTAESDETAIAAIINRGGGPATAEPVATPAPIPPAPIPPTPVPPVAGPVLVPVPAVEPPPPVSAPVPPPKPAAAVEATDPEKKFTLRLSASLLAAIEKDAKGRPDRISVNTWLIGAALQRLERSGG